MSKYVVMLSETGGKESDELFSQCREPADASRHGRDRSRILLCNTGSFIVF